VASFVLRLGFWFHKDFQLLFKPESFFLLKGKISQTKYRGAIQTVKFPRLLPTRHADVFQAPRPSQERTDRLIIPTVSQKRVKIKHWLFPKRPPPPF